MEINVLLNTFRPDIFYITISISGLIISDINRHINIQQYRIYILVTYLSSQPLQNGLKEKNYIIWIRKKKRNINFKL